MKKAKYIPTNKTYKLTTVSDFGKIVTPENIVFLANAFIGCMESLLAVNAVNKAIAEKEGKEYSKFDLTHITWIDDGLDEIKEIEIKGGGKKKFIINKDTFKNFPETP